MSQIVTLLFLMQILQKYRCRLHVGLTNYNIIINFLTPEWQGKCAKETLFNVFGNKMIGHWDSNFWHKTKCLWVFVCLTTARGELKRWLGVHCAKPSSIDSGKSTPWAISQSSDHAYYHQAPLKSQAHQGTSLFTSAATNQRFSKR